MKKYIPSPSHFAADQVERYESSNGTQGWTLGDTDMPVIIVTHTGRKTGAIRKTPLMRAVSGDAYILIASQGGAPSNPAWYFNVIANPDVQIRDRTNVIPMRVREVTDPAERQRLWDIAVDAYPPYADYQKKTNRIIPVLIAEPVE